jgi:SAM-dependent methyltransferase
MDPEALDAAALLCKLAGAPDLLSWLGLPPTAAPPDARAALEASRKRMQAMQGNPKFKELAKHVIKTYRKLDELLADPAAYLATVHADRASTQLPLLESAIDAVLADGVITAEEEAHVREAAMRLGFAEEVYERVLADRCARKGVTVPQARQGGQRSAAVATVGPNTGQFRIDRNLRAAHRTAGTGWWDDAFTKMLLQLVPHDTRRVVDLACGLGWAAMALLPERAQVEYLGLDQNQVQVDMARKNLQAVGLGDRTIVQVMDASKLAVPPNAVDLVLCVMSLQNFRDTRPVFAEAARILRPGGRFVVVEPDSLGQQFWFDRSLIGFNDLFQELCERVDEALRDGSGVTDPLGQPGIAIGPELGARLAAAGLEPEETHVHALQAAQRTPFPAFARRLRKRVDAMIEAGNLSAEDAAARTVLRALDSLERDRDEARVGTGVHVLPLFAVAGVKRATS